MPDVAIRVIVTTGKTELLSRASPFEALGMEVDGGVPTPERGVLAMVNKEGRLFDAVSVLHKLTLLTLEALGLLIILGAVVDEEGGWNSSLLLNA